jgi:hypothetical protein
MPLAIKLVTFTSRPMESTKVNTSHASAKAVKNAPAT